MATDSVPRRKLGRYGPSIPALGFGLMGMSTAYGKAPSDEERFKVLDRALELGETFWDSSDMYGDNEDMLGRWFKRTGKRDQIFLASKFAINFKMGGPLTVDSSAEYCKRACERSLERLGTDKIDLYYCHRVNSNTPIEETMRALAELKAEGKINYIGLSEVSSTTLRRACKIAHVDAVQMEYSPFVLDIEGATGTNILQACRELGVAVVCYSPLGRGLLTGAYTTKESISGENDSRASWYPRFSDENFDANLKLVSQFKAFADKKGCTPGQLAIAWCLKQGDDFFPIPGTKKIKYLEENWGSLDVNLSDEEEAEVRRFVESAEVKGGRSAPIAIEFAYADTKEEA